MANVKITALNHQTSFADDDLFLVVDVGEDETRKFTYANLIGTAGNVHVVSANTTAVEARRVANVTISTNEDTALQSRLSSNVTSLTNEDTALQSRLSSNVTSLTNEDTAIEARRAANATISTNEDTALQARITANAAIVTAVEARRVANVTEQTAIEARRVANIAGAVSTITTSDLTASRALVSDGSGKVAVLASVTSTELGYVDATSSIQDQLDAHSTEDTALQARITANTLVAASNDFVTYTRLNANVDTVQDNVASNATDITALEARRVANIAGAISSVLTSDLTASRALVSGSGGKVEVSDVTATELGYLDGVSSAIQTQLAAKAALAGATFTGQVNMSDDLVVTGNLTVNGDTTTVSTTNLDVEDRMIMLADGVTGSPSADVGILFNRGNQGNAAIFYDESATTFKLSDTKDPKSNTALSPVSAANLMVGTANATTLNATTVTQNGATLDNLIGSNVDGAISTVNDTNLTASRALVSSSGGKIEVSAITATEIGYLDGVSSAVQTQLNAKQATITGAATTIDDADLTASRALVSDGSGKVAVSAVTATELGYLDGVSSAIQTQIDNISSTSNAEALAAEDVALQARITANAAIVTAVEARRAANVTISTNEDTAIEARRAANVTISTNEDTALQARITANAAIVTAVEARRVANVTEQTAIEARRVANIAGAVSTITTSDLTASRALVSDGSGKVAVLASVTSTELGYVDATSSIQDQLDAHSTEDTALQARITANAAIVTAVEARRVANVTEQTAIEARRVANIAGAVSTITTSDLTASRALVSDGSGKVAISDITSTELGYLDGVSSAIQTQLNSKQATITGAATTIDDADLTASRALVSDGSGKVAVSDVTATELGYLDGVSSAIQTQLAAKAALAGATFTGQVNMSDDLVVTGNLTVNGATTTVSTTNLDVEDRMIMLADGVTGSPSADVGLLFNRGNQGNAAIFYDESAKTFKLSDTKDPKSNTSISPVTASNLDVGILTAATVIYNGADLNTSITDNAAALQARITANAAIVTAVEARRVANVTEQTAIEARRVANIAGAVSSITTSDLTASRAMVTNGSGKVAVSDITATELGYLDGVSSAIQTQLNSKQATITGAATTIDDADLTASRALVSDGSGKVAVSAVTATEVGHLDGVTSAIQTQINGLETRRDANVTVAASNNAALESRRTSNIAGAVSTITTSDLTASRALVSSGSGKVGVSDVTATELGYLDGVSSAIQTQLNAKQATITGAATTIDDADLTASRALVSSGSGKVGVSDVTSTELGYLDGVSSAIQTQLDAKAATTDLVLSNILHTTSTANSYATGGTTSNLDKVLVYLNGIYQNENQYVLGNSTHNVQFKDATLASGLELEIRKL